MKQDDESARSREGELRRELEEELIRAFESIDWDAELQKLEEQKSTPHGVSEKLLHRT